MTNLSQPSQPVRLSDLGELLAGLSVFFGFRPDRSLIAISLDGDRDRLGFRLRADLPAVSLGWDDADYLADVLRRNASTRVLVVACSDDPAVADPTVRVVVERFRAAGIDVAEAVRCDGTRYWSYLCDDPACCPPEGRTYDEGSSRLVAEAVLEGREIAPDRATLAARVGPVTGADLDRMTAATATAATASADLADADRIARRMREIVDAAAADPEYILSDEEAATLSVGCAFGPIRDTAMSWIPATDAAGHARVWAQVARKVVPPHEAAVLGLAGLSAWLSGDGALAVCAVERAERADPEDSLVCLLRQILVEGLPPSAWRPSDIDPFGDDQEEAAVELG
jgi:Domain of unknown function (DUF4192)